MTWCLTHALCLGRSSAEGEYALSLSRSDGVHARAVIRVRSHRESCAGFDPSVAVLRCTDADARAWLEAPEHEYFVGEFCAGAQRGAA